MGEMRRIGGGPTQPSGAPRRPARAEARSSLLDRVAQVRTGGGPAEPAETGPSSAHEPEARRRLEAPSANGHNGTGNGSVAAGKKEAAESPASLPIAAEMPKAGEIPEKRRRPRLLDRITGLAKS
jgi:hypothetical protein